MPSSQRVGNQSGASAPRALRAAWISGKITPYSLFLQPGDDVLVFLIPCVCSGAMLTYFLTVFHSNFSTVDRAGASIADLPPRPESVRGTVGRIGNFVTESADG